MKEALGQSCILPAEMMLLTRLKDHDVILDNYFENTKLPN